MGLATVITTDRPYLRPFHHRVVVVESGVAHAGRVGTTELKPYRQHGWNRTKEQSLIIPVASASKRDKTKRRLCTCRRGTSAIVTRVRKPGSVRPLRDG